MDAEATGNLPHVVLSVSHEGAGHREITGGELRLAASETPTGACGGEPCPRALPNQVALKFGQRSEDMEDELAASIGGIDAFVQRLEPDASIL